MADYWFVTKFKISASSLEEAKKELARVSEWDDPFAYESWAVSLLKKALPMEREMECDELFFR